MAANTTPKALQSGSEAFSSDISAPGKRKSGRKVALAFLRNDLRLHDNASLYYAHNSKNGATHVLPIYVFDERHVECSGLPGFKRKGSEARTRLCGFWRSGVFKTRFLAEAVYDIQHRLKDRGSGLLVRFGRSEEVIENIVRALQACGDEVVSLDVQKEICAEEIAVENGIKRRLSKLNVPPIRLHETKQMIHKDDLPFPIEETPDVFTPFRKRVEALGDKMVRKMLDMPEHFLPFPHSEDNPIRDDDNHGRQVEKWSLNQVLEALFVPLKGSYEMKYSSPNFSRHKSTAFPWVGGETSALDRLDYYFLEGRPPPVARYKETRNMLLGHAYSTKMSPFLSIGCISPRQLTAAIDMHEKQYGSSQNTYWVRFELLWRDYFLYVSEKFGNNLFKLEGYEGKTDPKMAAKKVDDWNDWDPDNYRLKAWLRGRTGVPFIDANIIELRETGFMSNRGRQNVASFLTKDLYFDWRIGAEFFESHLIDYEPTANWGNWQYVAGCGNDPRASRQFNPIKQARDYDPHGEYVRTWISQLSNIPSSKVHTPWLLSDQEWKRYLSVEEKKDKSREPVGVPATASRQKQGQEQGQQLSTEAVGRIGVADGPRRRNHSGGGNRNTGSGTNSRGTQYNNAGTSTSGQSGSESEAASSNSLQPATGSSAESASGGDQSSGNRLFGNEGSSSDSTGVSSYASSDQDGGDINADKSSPSDYGSAFPGTWNVLPTPDIARPSSTVSSVPSQASASTNTGASDGNASDFASKITHRSAALLTKSLKEKDDFVESTPYPRRPLFEQDSWKPHYHRKDFGRKRGGPGGGNSRRLIRTPPVNKS